MSESSETYADVPVVVLGANGFIGSHFVDHLVAAGRDVVALDRFRDESRKFNSDPGRVEFVDFDDNLGIDRYLDQGCQVVHAIGSDTPWTSLQSGKLSRTSHQLQLFRILEACKARQISHFYFSSSGGAVYGENVEGKCHEDFSLRPISDYGRSKVKAEELIAKTARQNGFGFTIWRFSNVYGPRQVFSKGQGLVARAFQSASTSSPMPILGDGGAIRDFIYSEDAVRLASGLMEKTTRFNYYNVGSGVGTTVTEVLRQIEYLTGTRISVTHKEAPQEFVKRNVLDVSRLESELGELNNRSLQAGLRETWESREC